MMALPASLALAFAPSAGAAGIEYVGGQTSGRTGSATTLAVNFALSGGIASVPADGDLVVICCAVGTSLDSYPAQAISGYTALGQVNVNGSSVDLAVNVSYKRMTATPDTQFTVPNPNSTARGQAWTVQVFRGVDPAADLTALFATASSPTAAMPNPPSMTPTLAGSWVVVCGATAASTGATFTPPANFVDDFLTYRQSASVNASVGSGYWGGWSSGAVDPGAYTGWGGTASSAAYTLVLPPA